MSAPDLDLHCSKAPTPVPDERFVKTERIDIADAESGGGKGWYVLAAFLALAVVAGVVFTLVKNGADGPVSASTAEAVTQGSGSSATVAPATVSGAQPAECAGEVADAQLRWYCTQFLPFAQKASADHDRIDRLEAQGKDGPEGPLALWVIVIAVGLLTLYNTVKIHSTKDDRPPG